MTNTTNNDWKAIKLSDVADYINRGVSPIYTQDNAGTAVVNQKCIRDGQVNFDLSRLTDESTRQVPQDKLVQPYDILINSTGTGTVGRVAQVADLTKRTTVDSHVTIVRPKQQSIDPIYLGYWMKTKEEELEKLASGSTNQVELSRIKIAEVDVILPPRNTQKKISEIIATLDYSINKTGQIIGKVEILKQGLMEKLLMKGIGHKKFKKTKLGELPEEWELLALEKVCDVRDGTHTSPKYVADGIPLITSKNLIGNSLDFTNVGLISIKDHIEIERRSKVDDGDILFGMIGTIGKPILVKKTKEFSIKNVALIKFTKSNINNVYLLNYLKFIFTQQQFMQYLGGSTQKFIALGIIRKLLISLPPKIEQIKIANILSTFDKKISIESVKKEKLLSLKKGLIQDVFSQKIKIN